MGRTKNKRKTLGSNVQQNPPLQRLDPSSQINLPINKNQDENSDNRNWNDLPESILTSIFNLLPSVADLASVASVSHQWNSAAASSTSFSSKHWAPQRPPLLLMPILNSTFSRFNRYTTSPRYELIPVVSAPTSKHYRHTMLCSQTMAKSFCVGCHFSKLILISNNSIVLHDVFTGEQISSPKMAYLRGLYINFGTLTAPLCSSSLSLVLLVGHQTSSENYHVISWEPNGTGKRDGKFVIKVEIVSFILFNNQIYYLDLFRRVGVVEFEPEVSWRLLDGTVMKNSQTSYGYSHPIGHLIECDGELLMLLFIRKQMLKMNIEIYKLDLEKRMWVKKDKLDNWCLFADLVRKTGYSCKDPEKWGGRSNCIYVPAPNCSGWGWPGWGICMFNEEIDMMEAGSLFLSLDAQLPKWPSPLWVYPDIRKVKKIGSGKAEMKFKKLKRRDY